MKISDLKGASFNAVIPVSQELLNRLITEQLDHPIIEDFSLDCRSDNCLGIDLTIRKGLKAHRYLVVSLEENIGFPDSPRLRMHIHSGLKLIDKALINFVDNRMPYWISLSRDFVSVNLEPILSESGYGDYINYIDSAYVDIEQEELTIKLSLSI